MKKIASRILSLALAFLLLPAFPATATDPLSGASSQTESWAFFTDDFDSYPTGDDTFWKADTVNYTQFLDQYHGQSLYGVADVGDGKALRLMTSERVRTWFAVNHRVTGEYTVQFDYLFEQSQAGEHIAVNLFQSYSFPTGTILLYIRPDSTYVTDNTSGAAISFQMPGSGGGRFVSAPDNWYTVRVAYRDDSVLVKIWPRHEAEPADDAAMGVMTVTSPRLTQAVYDAAKLCRIHYMYTTAGISNMCYARIDNLALTKDIPAVLSDVSIILSDETPTHQLTLDTGDELPVPAVLWESDDPQVAKVSPAGMVWGKGPGTATVTATLLDVRGRETDIVRSCAVQAEELTPVEEPLRVLIIGNSFSRDSLYYVSSLAKFYDRRVEPAYLYIGSCTLRMHAQNASSNAASYVYYTCDAETGVWSEQSQWTMARALGDREWDVVALQQGVAASGFAGTYNSDIDYMVDYIRAHSASENPRILWNMTWANQTGHSYELFNKYYGGVQSWMYNAIARCVNNFIFPREDIEAVVPTGTAIQKGRAVLGDILTRDGYHLSTKAGRLIAGLTWLKTLFPDVGLSALTAQQLEEILVNEYHATQPELDDTYENTDANLALVIAAVEAACGEASGESPEIQAITAPAPETHPTELLVGQAAAPDLLHFPDAVVIPSSGRVLAASYRNIAHTPTYTTLEEGVGDIVLHRSDDSGISWSEPAVLVNQQKLREWGIDEGMYDRFSQLLASPSFDYVVVGDPRDPNFAVVHVDLNGDGDKEEVVLLTFWVRYIKNSGNTTIKLFMMQSTDGGAVWSAPQEITAQNSSRVIKRGDIAVFADGEILVPIYSPVEALRMRWNVIEQTWERIGEYPIPLSTERSATLNEVSFVSPDGSDTVYAFVRESGEVLSSPDRGETWESIAYEDRLIHQPGFAVIDPQRVFVTYAGTTGPRSVYGKVFYPAAGWNESETRLIYASPNTVAHDTGDPSARVLPDGRVLVVYYDTHYRAILGTVVDPDDFLPMETTDELPSALLFAEDFDDLPPGAPYQSEYAQAQGTEIIASGTGGALALSPDGFLAPSETFTGSGTARMDVLLESGGVLDVELSDSSGVRLTGAALSCLSGSHSIPLSGNAHSLRVSIVGGLLYVKVWPAGQAEPTQWSFVCNEAAQEALREIRLEATGSGRVIVDSLTLSRKLKLSLPATLSGTVGDPPVTLTLSQYPVLSEQPVWQSDNEAVATVAQDGTVFFLGEGAATVTATVRGITVSCAVSVKSISAELTAEGILWPFFTEDFDGYTPGENAFYDALSQTGRFLSQPANAPTADNGIRYDIVENGDRRQLTLQSVNGKSAWFKANTQISGEYTARFDLSFSGAKPSGGVQFLYVTLFQDSDVHAFVHLTPEGVRVQYRETPGSTGTLVETSQLGSEIVYPLGTWHSVRIVRTDSGLFVKVWQADNPEPDEWDVELQHSVLSPDKVSTFRMQYYVTGTSPRTVSVDNLVLSKYIRSMETVETALTGQVGDSGELALSFGGMVAGHLPTPAVQWASVTNEALSLDGSGHVEYLSPGSGTLCLTARLMDVFGDPSSALFSAELPFIVTAEEEPGPEYTPWAPGQTVSVGDIRSYEDRLYACVQSHTTQAGWIPSAVPALWKAYHAPGEAAPWVQPTGAHDAYRKGEVVLYNGRIFECVIDYNVWSPDAYPAGWHEIEES